MKRSFIREILEAIDEQTISFAGGLPDETLFPIKHLQKAAKKVLQNKKNYQYTVSTGIEALREKIAHFYNKEGFETKPKNILITTGSQQALYIIAKYFQDKAIVIERPSYLGAVNIFKANNLSMHPIALHHDGIDVTAFSQAYEKIKLAYIIPDFHNPKSSCYAKNKREAIVQTVLKNGGYIIEDAPYSQLYFKNKQACISVQIPNNSFHLGSFSKTLTPGLRIGWVRANESIITQLTQIKETMDLHSSSISQHILNEYLSHEKKYEKHLKTLRKQYEKKMQFFAKSLQKILPEFEFEKPKGGMFIYGKLPNHNTKELVYKALEHKVVYVPGSEFYTQDSIIDEIRFNYTHCNKKQVIQGLKRLKKII
jgi:2-aminoadipate transaminase